MTDGIPEGWKVTTIEQLTKTNSLFSDGDWVESKDQDPKGNNRLIQLADIGDGKFLNKSARFMNDEQFAQLKCTPLKKRDVLIARMPDPLGRACLFPELNQRCATVVDVAIIRTEGADRYWLMSAINSPGFRRQIEINASGTTRTRISRGGLSSIRLFTPPLPEQQKIAAILTSIDEVIEKTEAQISKLQDLKKGMMQELLTKGIGHTEFKDSPVGRIPREWELHPLGQLFSIQLGKMLNKKTKEGKSPFPYLANRNVQWGKVLLDSLPMMDFDERERKKFELRKRDLLVCEGGEVGRTAIWDTKLSNCYYQKAVHRLRPKNSGCIPRYYLYVMEFIVKANLLKNFVSQTSIAHLTKENLEEIPVPFPSKDEQEKIASIIYSTERQIRNHENKYESLTHLKKSLMQDLLTGKVRVKVN